MKTFDLIVIGAGAGLNVASEAAIQGLKIAIIEEGPMGGTCLNRGCIPSKIVIHSADVVDTIKNSQLFGISSIIKKIDFNKIIARASCTVDADAESIEKAVKKGRNPTLFKGRGKFVGDKILEVNGQKIKGKKVLIAAGAHTFIPLIEGLDKIPFVTSKEALRQTKLPKSMIIIGGGYIGVELGNFYAALGCKVTMVQRGPLLISREDKDVAKLYTNLAKKRFNLLTNAAAVKVEKKFGKAIVHVKQGKKIHKVKAEKLFLATGVKPNSDTLDLEKTGVKVNIRGFIEVDKFMETNVKNVWALGDIVGNYMFRHSANLEADYVSNNILRGKKAVDYFPMPHVVFSNPQIAGVGLTEQEAIEQKKNFVIGVEYYKNTGMGEALQEKDGFVKFIVEKKSRRILGCHLIGPHASILLHEVVVAMKSKENALDLIRNTVHVHPALNEVVQRAALNVPL